MTKQELEKGIMEYGKDIYSFCLKLSRNKADADELYQDTFVTALEQVQSIDEKNNPKSYLLSIAMRHWKNRKRKMAWRKRIWEEDYLPVQGSMKQPEGIPEEEMIEQESLEVLRASVDKLPERWRIVILLYYMEERSITQIAAILSLSEGTVKSRLFHARKKLKKIMEDYYERD